MVTRVFLTRDIACFRLSRQGSFFCNGSIYFDFVAWNSYSYPFTFRTGNGWF